MRIVPETGLRIQKRLVDESQYKVSSSNDVKCALLINCRIFMELRAFFLAPFLVRVGWGIRRAEAWDIRIHIVGCVRKLSTSLLLRRYNTELQHSVVIFLAII